MKIPKTDPLILAAKKAYRLSAVGQLDRLLVEQRKWKRRKTIADSKLCLVRTLIENFALELAKEKVKS